MKYDKTPNVRESIMRETYKSLCKEHGITPMLLSERNNYIQKQIDSGWISFSDSYIEFFKLVEHTILQNGSPWATTSDAPILHRLDGPAIVWVNGSTYWFINGYNVSTQIRKWANKSGINLSRLSYADKALIKLIWADYDGK